MTLNEEKCHLLVFGEKDSKVPINVGLSVTIGSNEKKLLSIIIEQKLNFKPHLFTVCKKASQRLHALARASTCMPEEKTRIVMSAFAKSQFGYCPIICRFTIGALT